MKGRYLLIVLTVILLAGCHKRPFNLFSSSDNQDTLSLEEIYALQRKALEAENAVMAVVKSDSSHRWVQHEHGWWYCYTSMSEDHFDEMNYLLRFYGKNLAAVPDLMKVSRTSGSYTASFTSGVMYTVYGATVPAGWLVPLPYVKVGRPEAAGEECAKVRLIVPHSQGHATASSNVMPYYYVVTFLRES